MSSVVHLYLAGRSRPFCWRAAFPLVKRALWEGTVRDETRAAGTVGVMILAMLSGNLCPLSTSLISLPHPFSYSLWRRPGLLSRGTGSHTFSDSQALSPGSQRLSCSGGW